MRKNTIIRFNLIGLLLVAVITFVSCKEKDVEPLSPDELFEKYNSSVVLIACEYYYEITSSNNTSYYYSPDSEIKIYFSEEDVIKNVSSSTGTGFIISEDGKIITNNHVVNSVDETFKEEVLSYRQKFKNIFSQDFDLLTDSITKLKDHYYIYADYMNDGEQEQAKQKYRELNEKKETVSNLYLMVDKINPNNSTSKIRITRLGVAFNDTHVTNFNDLQECVVIKTSSNINVDLAIIQTKTKEFNKKPKNILNFDENNQNILNNPEQYSKTTKREVKINDDVFMIGYNRGFSLANTKNGIKSQFTSGKISQESDGDRILYTIPTLEGSSGSPIVDKWGNLVGVNFAKLTNSQNFSFGVPVSQVKKFYEE